jgi:alkanesulfonate monooxygenase SsuD/methylene tetrahydromethanopterin reductase-like flavin-dependent oxidoreductase (luciferase family)
MIPIWIGGSDQEAFKLAGQLGDGFMFAGSLENCEHAWATVNKELVSAGREAVDFGADLLTSAASTMEEVLAAIDFWYARGGTHVSVISTGMGFQNIDGHIDFIARLHDRLGDYT